MAMHVIEWLEGGENELVHRISPETMTIGSQLVVQEYQWAAFFRDGKCMDVFTAGRHTLTTANLPILTSLLKIPFKEGTPFRADVYFISRKVFPSLKWGTKEPVVFRDSEFDMLRLRAFGVFSLRVSDPSLFLNTLVGSQGMYTTDSIEDFLRGVIVARLNDVLGETLKTVLDLPRYYDELAEALKGRVHSDFGKYGLVLPDFLIKAITPPDEVQKKIDERSGMAAVGNMSRYTQFQTAQAMRDAAQNTGGGAAGAGMGAGVGIGLGMTAAQTMAQSAAAAQAGAAAENRCGACHSAMPAGAKFCPHCGQGMKAGGSHCPKCRAELPPGAKFCLSCGAALASSASGCRQCHAEVPAGAKFCPSCGAKSG
jgi:membrane protease subunit (stomatin/prohibitin family)